nr:MAG TPA: hypothetical protein [Caudoviricetes sp.]
MLYVCDIYHNISFRHHLRGPQRGSAAFPCPYLEKTPQMFLHVCLIMR